MRKQKKASQVAAGPVSRKPVSPFAKENGQRGQSGGSHIPLTQTYDRQSYGFRKQNNADPTPKIGG